MRTLSVFALCALAVAAAACGGASRSGAAPQASEPGPAMPQASGMEPGRALALLAALSAAKAHIDSAGRNWWLVMSAVEAMDPDLAAFYVEAACDDSEQAARVLEEVAPSVAVPLFEAAAHCYRLAPAVRALDLEAVTYEGQRMEAYLRQAMHAMADLGP